MLHLEHDSSWAATCFLHTFSNFSLSHRSWQWSECSHRERGYHHVKYSAVSRLSVHSCTETELGAQSKWAVVCPMGLQQLKTNTGIGQTDGFVTMCNFILHSSAIQDQDRDQDIYRKRRTATRMKSCKGNTSAFELVLPETLIHSWSSRTLK